jgi:hypothetical protein
MRLAAFPHSALTRRVNCGVFVPRRPYELSAVRRAEATCRPTRDYSRLARTRKDSWRTARLGDRSETLSETVNVPDTRRVVEFMCGSEYVLCVLESEKRPCGGVVVGVVICPLGHWTTVKAPVWFRPPSTAQAREEVVGVWIVRIWSPTEASHQQWLLVLSMSRSEHALTGRLAVRFSDSLKAYDCYG